jgi:hypothetical protein
VARTILDIATEVCDRVTVNVPSTLFGTNDNIARKLRVAAKDTLRDLMRGAMKNGISGFHSQWVFATKPGVYAYQLPPDFYKMLPGTEQRSRWPLGILGPVTPQTWSNWISGLQYTAVPMGWRIKNNLIHFEPPPTQEEIVVIEYLSRFPVARDATDADLAPVNGYLQPIAPLVPREGYIHGDALDVVETTGPTWGEAVWGTAVWGTTAISELRRIPTSSTKFPDYQVRAEEFTSDDDLCAIDDDHVVSLGMTWRLRKGLMMSYAEEYDEYDREKDVFLSNDGSTARTVVFGDTGPREEIAPLGDGQWSVT